MSFLEECRQWRHLCMKLRSLVLAPERFCISGFSLGALTVFSFGLDVLVLIGSRLSDIRDGACNWCFVATGNTKVIVAI